MRENQNSLSATEREGVTVDGSGSAENREGGEGSAQILTGRPAVRVLLIERLEAAGLTRKRGVSVEAHEQGKKHLVEKLSYMAAENLETLAEIIIDNCPDGVWPVEIVILNEAKNLEPPPIRDSRIFSSWLASVKGPEALAQGILVELYRFLLPPRRRPPGPMDWRALQDEAGQNRRRIMLIEERDAPSDQDQAWLKAYRRDELIARDIVECGNKKREGSAA